MAYVNINFTSTPKLPEENILELAQRISQLLAEVMGADQELTTIRVNQTEPDNWIVGGTPVRRAGHNAAAMDIYVSKGDAKARQVETMIRESHKLLEDFLSPLHEATYIMVHELSAHAWGYDGKTQAKRTAPKAIAA